MFLPEQYQRLTAEMREIAATQAADRRSQGLSTEIRLLLVSKYQSKENIEQALDYFSKHAPCPKLGESYVQNAEKRFQELREYQKSNLESPAVQLELIGPLQSNKAEKAIQLFSTIHSISKPKLVNALIKARKKLRDQTPTKRTQFPIPQRLNIFLQYNASGEEQKNGCRNYCELRQLLEIILPHKDDFCVRGLMCMAPASFASGANASGANASRANASEANASKARRIAFADCREQALRLWREFHTENTKNLLPQPELSMGMSQDYREALAEGANILRIGSLLFSN